MQSDSASGQSRPKSSRLGPDARSSLEGALLLDPGDFDDAIFAVARTEGGTVAVYDYDLLIGINHGLLVRSWEQDGRTYERPDWEDATSDVDMNMVGGVRHLGGRAPLIVATCDDVEDAEPEDLVKVDGTTYVRC